MGTWAADLSPPDRQIDEAQSPDLDTTWPRPRRLPRSKPVNLPVWDTRGIFFGICCAGDGACSGCVFLICGVGWGVFAETFSTFVDWMDGVFRLWREYERLRGIRD